MDGLLSTLAANTAVALPLALLALLAERHRTRPGLAYALWLLVLVKLVTPPLFHVPIALPRAPAVNVQPAPESAPLDVEALVPLLLAAAESDATAAAAPAAMPVAGPVADPAVAAAGEDAPPPAPFPWSTILWTLWIAGGAGTLVVAFSSIGRFSAALRRARPAPWPLRRRAEELGEKLGLRKVPRLCILPDAVSPMLWSGTGGARLVLPERLLARLDDAATTTLLAHELAHYRRRDHWVRYLELFVRSLHWWNPLAWWACHRLRIAEEQCCDAWVVWALPQASRSYADALVETVEFLSATPAALPATGSGMGGVHLLQRRLTMILRDDTTPTLSRGARLAVVALFALALPILPALAQDPEPTPAPHLRAVLKDHEAHVKALRAEARVLREHMRDLKAAGDVAAAQEARVQLEHLVQALTAARDRTDQIAAEFHEQASARRAAPRPQGREHESRQAVLRALKAAIHSLRQDGRDEEAQVLLRFAERFNTRAAAAPRARPQPAQPSNPFAGHPGFPGLPTAEPAPPAPPARPAPPSLPHAAAAPLSELGLPNAARAEVDALRAERDALRAMVQAVRDESALTRAARSDEAAAAAALQQHMADIEQERLIVEKQAQEQMEHALRANVSARDRQEEMAHRFEAMQLEHQGKVERLEAKVEELAEMVKQLAELAKRKQAEQGNNQIR